MNIMSMLGLVIIDRQPKLRSGDKFVLKVKVSESSAARIFFEHYIYKLPNNEPILEAKSVVVLLGKNYRPVRMPTEVKSKLRQLMMHQEAAQRLLIMLCLLLPRC
uniref:Uncharacterized protein n=1 Tax=Chenopodium quinoa TaxID=63459 RepID=A0A803NEX1_CHEQI